MKKILAIALVVCMMMTFASFPVSAAIASPATLTVVSAPGARSGYTGEKALDGDYKIGYAINNYNGSISTNNAQTLVYDLGKVTIRNGWVQPPPPTTVEIMELRIRADEADEKIALLEGIFDTNALNFII